MYKYFIEIVEQKLKEEREKYASIEEQQNAVSKKLEDIQNYGLLKVNYGLYRGMQVSAVIFSIVAIGLIGLLISGSIIEVGNAEAQKIIDTVFNGLGIATIGAASLLNYEVYRETKKAKQKLKEAPKPDETEDELKQERTQLKKQLKSVKENLQKNEKALENIDLIKAMELCPMILADNEEEFKQLTKTVEKGNQIFEEMKNERIDYQNIRLIQEPQENIHKSCGKKLGKVLLRK